MGVVYGSITVVVVVVVVVEGEDVRRLWSQGQIKTLAINKIHVKCPFVPVPS